MFIGGKNAILALDMLSAAKKALVPPFGISFFADPQVRSPPRRPWWRASRSRCRTRRKRSLKGLKVAVFGATGVVGFSSAVIAALEGADVTLVGYDGIKRVSEAAREIKARFQADVAVADGSDDAKKAEILAEAEAALCAGRAGVRDSVERATRAGEASSDRGRRQRRSAFRRRGPGHDGERRGAHSRTVRSASVRLRSATSSTRPNSACSRSMIAATKPVTVRLSQCIPLARELNG